MSIKLVFQWISNGQKYVNIEFVRNNYERIMTNGNYRRIMVIDNYQQIIFANNHWQLLFVSNDVTQRNNYPHNNSSVSSSVKVLTGSSTMDNTSYLTTMNLDIVKCSDNQI